MRKKLVSFTIIISILLTMGSMLIDEVEGQQNLINPYVSDDLVRDSQNIDENSLVSLRDIFYYISIFNLTSTPLGEEKNMLKARLWSYQNPDGGFGDWRGDRSKAGSTLTAVRALEMLDSKPLNLTGSLNFISRLQVEGLNYGNYGFRSSLKEGDADISSTYDAVSVFHILGGIIPNIQGVRVYAFDHQNTDGGFGYQTNRESGIIWDSTVLHSHRGIIALDILGEEPVFRSEVVSFIRSQQGLDGGFRNEPDGNERVSYTYNAVEGLSFLNEEIPRKEEIVSFLGSLKMSNGGYLEDPLDTKTGLHSTYFALRTLNILNIPVGNDSVDFAIQYLRERIDGGFGDYPGLASNSRTTFNAVSLLNRIGKAPDDPQAVYRFINGLKNADGGYGHNGVSNVETTYRSILTLHLLGYPVDHVSVISFIRSLQNNNGGFPFAEGYPSRTAYTYRAIRTLELLGSRPLNIVGAIEYLHERQNPDGGFGNYAGETSSDIASVYRAIRGLSILGSMPFDRKGAEDFVTGSQNPDGGFRRSPDDRTYPANLSTSFFTYDGVLSAYFLGISINDDAGAYRFIESLRNPDLGFGEKEFFTSTTSDTFSALWSFMVLFDDMHFTELEFSIPVISPSDPTTSDLITFDISLNSTRNVRPESVILIVNGESIPMYPITPMNWTYSVDVQLPLGAHDIMIETFNGIKWLSSELSVVTVVASGPIPIVDLEVDRSEGLQDTIFSYIASYYHDESLQPVFVEINIDGENWIEMEMGDDGSYYLELNMAPGNHYATARGFDGTNYGYSSRMEGPLVHAINPTKPDWGTFLNIREFIVNRYGVSTNYTDVDRVHYLGQIGWRVNVSGEPVYLNNHGTGLLERDEETESAWLLVTISTIVLVAIVFVIAMIIFSRSRREDE